MTPSFSLREPPADGYDSSLMTTMTRLLIAGLAATLLGSCDGSGTGPDPGETRILVVGVARNDASPRDPLEGHIVLFFDIDREILLSAEAAVNGLPLEQVIEVNEGPIYLRGSQVQPGTAYSLAAEVSTPEGTVQVSSQPATPPAEFAIEAPADHPLGQPLEVRWDPVPGATGINVAAGSGFDMDLPATATSVTIPASAFAGLAAGSTIEIEVTPYDVFYISVSAGVSGILDAGAFVERFTGNENVQGARGAFGAATTVGTIVTLE